MNSKKMHCKEVTKISNYNQYGLHVEMCYICYKCVINMLY